MPDTITDEITVLFAYVDESGSKGLVRNLTESKDDKFGLMAALLFHHENHDAAVERFTPGFDEFKNAAPAGAKLHFTDAYIPGHEDWAKVADKVRADFTAIILEIKPMIIYGARRLALVRAAHQRSADVKASAQTSKQSKVKITGADRPSENRVEDDLILSLSLRLDGWGEILEQNGTNAVIDLLFDHTDAPVAKRYETIIEQTRHLSNSSRKVFGWDTVEKKRVEGEVAFSIEDASIRLDTKFIRNIEIVGKDHPLVLAADLVANYLRHHLDKLSPQAPLNAESSIEGWVFAERVWGVSNDASDDLF